MKVTVWGARGSVPSPGPETTRYGGNTTCVQVELPGGQTLILDAGTGIRSLGMALTSVDAPLHILLTHLHLDHIQGLMFFAPAFQPGAKITVWGPSAPEAPLCDRIARYISAPLTPVEIRELPCEVDFREAEETAWTIGGATVRSASVSHRGPTLGYRIECGGISMAFVPDHEPGLGADLATLPEEWISGFELVRGVDLLVHDCQYTDEEYPRHLGWGHSRLTDVLTLARRAEVGRLLLFHHDPLHTDEFLDRFAREAVERWTRMGGDPGAIGIAEERQVLELRATALGGAPDAAPAASSPIAAEPA